MADPAAIEDAVSDEPAPAVEPKSIAEDLVAKREQLSKEREPKIFDLPGYGSALQVKYRVPTRTEAKEAKGLVFKLASAGEENADIVGMCKLLSLACVAFFEEKDGESVLLNESRGLGDAPIRWGDQRLADLLGIEVEGKLRARFLIEEVLATPERIEIHHNQVTNWADRALEADDADF
jgi:hypothetical protein